MAKTEFNLGIMFVDDDPAIIDQHQMLLDNRAFRKQTPGRIYQVLRDNDLISSSESIDAILRDGGWPTKEDLADYLSINPDVDDPYTIAIPDVAYSADDARKIWKNKQSGCASKLGVCIALLDHDMPGESGLELAGYFQQLKEKGMAVPVIIFYTGKAALLEEALESDGYKQKIASIASTGLAEAVLQKGASNEEFNEVIWAAIKKSVQDIKQRGV